MKEILINCKVGEGFALPLSSGQAVPADIQWMPPGRHEIWPEGFDAPFEINVTEVIASVANAELQRQRNQAAAGSGNWPYADFNHEDREQSFEPLEFFWGGNDPKSGGVRVRAEWSAAGEAAIRGKTFRSFSPSWRLNSETRQFLGIGLNVGGLVNRSAFQSIQAVAKGAAPTTTNQNNTMNEQDKKDIAEMISGAVKPITEQLTVLAKLPDRITKLETPAAAKGTAEQEAETNRLTDLFKTVAEPLIKRIEAIETGNQTVILASAKAIVDDVGVIGGRIGAQDKEGIDFWTKQIAADAKAVDQLKKIPQNPAFLQVVQANARGGNTTTTTTGSAEEFVETVKVHAKSGKKQSEAVDLAIAEKPDAYKAWRDANGKPGLVFA